MARPDKNKFIRMQATESLEYIPVKGPLGKQRNHFNSFLSAVTRAFSRGEKSCFIVACAIFTVDRTLPPILTIHYGEHFNILGQAGPMMRAGPSSFFLSNKTKYWRQAIVVDF